MTTPRRDAKRSGAVLVYLLVLIVLQVFLLVVAVEGFMGDESSLSWVASLFSVALFATALGFLRLLGDD